MKRAKFFGRLMAMVLALALLLPMALPVCAAAADKKEPWEKNVMRKNPLDRMVGKRSKVVFVGFMDSTEYIPEDVFYLGTGKIKNVVGWVDWVDGMAYVYIAAEGGINARHCFEMFRDCINLEGIDFNNAFHTDEATTMQGMFQNCNALNHLDLSEFNTANVKNMNAMFSGCKALEELDLTSFDTAKVTNMGSMFAQCTELIGVDVTSFDTSKVTNMNYMFRWCENLEDFDFSGWDVSKVKKHKYFMEKGMRINGSPWEYFFD